ncbi:MAG TPA: phosphopantetheine-binding protein [Trinickia sp.]|uniref:phosphopantetheine-binding protein n=1 Tax=Trinickia sp. TaxID=2571163 RepID=UPI002F40E3D2
MDEIERELAKLITEGLDLDIDPQSIDPATPIFGEGLGLDSIDALELGLLLSSTYRITITPGDQKNHEIFRSLRALGRHVEQHRAAQTH